MADSALKLAIQSCGGSKAIATGLGISRQAVEQWRRAPASRVLQLERTLNVSRHILRPDLYPKPEARP
nr:Cro/CI family transcriptional regulator [Methylobacterium sp. Leaf100]